MHEQLKESRQTIKETNILNKSLMKQVETANDTIQQTVSEFSNVVSAFSEVSNKVDGLEDKVDRLANIIEKEVK